jgi:hypothetical protein
VRASRLGTAAQACATTAREGRRRNQAGAPGRWCKREGTGDDGDREGATAEAAQDGAATAKWEGRWQNREGGGGGMGIGREAVRTMNERLQARWGGNLGFLK